MGLEGQQRQANQKGGQGPECFGGDLPLVIALQQALYAVQNTAIFAHKGHCQGMAAEAPFFQQCQGTHQVQRVAGHFQGEVITGMLPFGPDLVADPPHHRVEEQEGLYHGNEEVGQIIIAADVRQLIEYKRDAFELYTDLQERVQAKAVAYVIGPGLGMA